MSAYACFLAAIIPSFNAWSYSASSTATTTISSSINITRGETIGVSRLCSTHFISESGSGGELETTTKSAEFFATIGQSTVTIKETAAHSAMTTASPTTSSVPVTVRES